jgi:quercetin dioxygenase-like cupin family protein
MSEKPLIDGSENRLVSLAAETQYVPNGIASRTLVRTPNMRVVLFGFAEGQELSEHASTQHALVHILSGECDFTIAGAAHRMKPGDMLYMKPNAPHALKAVTQFSMLLTLSKPGFEIK